MLLSTDGTPLFLQIARLAVICYSFWDPQELFDVVFWLHAKLFEAYLR